MRSDYPFINSVRGIIGLDHIPGTQVLDFKRAKKSEITMELSPVSREYAFMAKEVVSKSGGPRPNAARPRVARRA